MLCKSTNEVARHTHSPVAKTMSFTYTTELIQHTHTSYIHNIHTHSHIKPYLHIKLSEAVFDSVSLFLEAKLFA